jgi:DNA polymerase
VRSQVYIANVLKCRPPGNRDPLPSEIETCVPFLAEQVRLIAPSVIATLGNFATRAVLGTERGITQLRGRLFHVDGRRVVPIYHPAAALYDQTKRDVLFGDFQRLKRVLEMPQEPVSAPAVPDSPAVPDAPGEQPTLF